jgi:hypothetical protein
MLNRYMCGRVLDTVMYDWMHIFVVNGLVHREAGLLLGRLHKNEGIVQSSLHNLVSSFTPPAYLKG